MLDAIDNRTELRLQLLHGGYTPLLNIDKEIRLKRWNTIRVDEKLIRSWSRSRLVSTGIRVENGLVAIDADILIEDLADAAWKLMPAGALKRIGRPPKWLAMVRLDGKAPTKLFSNAWTDGVEMHVVEIYTGKQQIGSFGWHTLGKRKYQWIGPSPLDVPLAQLPAVTVGGLRAICDAFDKLAEAAGLTKLVEIDHGAKRRVYDITDDTLFNDNQGRFGVTLEELARNYWAAAHSGCAYRVASPWTGSGANTDKCLVGWSPRHGCATVHDFPYDTTHLPTWADDGRGGMAELGEALKSFKGISI